MECPNCKYTYTIQEEVNSEYGSFYIVLTNIIRNTLKLRTETVCNLYGCPKCKIAFIEDKE